MQVKDRLDAQLIAAAILFTDGVAAMGADSSVALDALGDKYPTQATMINAALMLLAKRQPIDGQQLASTKSLQDEGTSSIQSSVTFAKNIQHLMQLGRELLQYAASPTPLVAAPAPEQPTPRVLEVAPDGTPVLEPGTSPTSPKQYALSLTHDELHIIYWALIIAEAAREQNIGFLNHATVLDYVTVYTHLRVEQLPDVAFNQFVDRFAAIHAIARRDNREVE